MGLVFRNAWHFAIELVQAGNTRREKNDGDTTTNPKNRCRRFFPYTSIGYVQDDNDSRLSLCFSPSPKCVTLFPSDPGGQEKIRPTSGARSPGAGPRTSRR